MTINGFQFDEDVQRTQPEDRRAQRWNLVVAIASAAASVYSQVKDNRFALTVFALLALLAFIAGYGRTVLALTRRLSRRLKNRRHATTLQPELSTFIGRFDSLVGDSIHSSGSLHYVLFEMYERNVTQLEKVCLPSPEVVWSGYKTILLNWPIKKNDAAEFVRRTRLLNQAIWVFSNSCLRPIYGPYNTQIAIPDARSKREIEKYREKFQAFLDSYSEFLEKVARALEDKSVQSNFDRLPSILV